jgi:DNA (cytosine-5)-methyltransferase 1
MNKPMLLDTFCKAGGAGFGYHLAGFDVVGVDIEPQKHYPFGFVQADAIEYIAEHGHEFDVIHASPPCQAYSVTKSLTSNDHPRLIEATRHVLIKTGKPYVIENVEGAPLINALMLCGSMFPGLRVYRHRLFECNPQIWFPPASCNHNYSMPASKGAYHALEKQEYITCVGNSFKASDGRIAMQIDWMTREELAQAIPPAYTKWIGEQLRKELGI